MKAIIKYFLETKAGKLIITGLLSITLETFKAFLIDKINDSDLDNISKTRGRVFIASINVDDFIKSEQEKILSKK